MSGNKGNENRVTYRRFDNSLRLAALITVSGIIASSFVIYFVLQRNSEQAVRSALFDQREQLQIQYTHSVSQAIASDLKTLMDKLETLALSSQIQEGVPASSDVHALLEKMYAETTKFSSVEGLYVLDQNNIVTSYFDPHLNSTRGSFIGYNASMSIPALGVMKKPSGPIFSNVYKSVPNGSLHVSLLYPIYSSGTGKYVGAVAMALDLRSFLSKYGNLDDVNSQYLVVLDRNATIMSSPFKDITGQNLFGNYASQGTSQVATDHYRKVLSGQASSALFDYRTGERLNTGEPVIVDGKPVYFAFIVTPTASIYALIGSILSTQETEVYVLFGSISIAVALSSFLILRMNTVLEKAVAERTRALREANDKLLEQENLQKEFINVAAHELRTPITPILVGLSMQIPESRNLVSIKRENYDMVVRNAKRLRRLAEDILDVTRIEGKNLKLVLEQVNLDQIIGNAIKDVRTDVIHSGSRIEYDPTNIVLMADRARLTEVISNLLSNAIKFTPEGTIRIKAAMQEATGDSRVEVIDSGSGIDPEILPKLFTKFATKSDQGTGLGLFICKSIIEAHGGKIWGKNNKEGRGASFGFFLPLS